MCISFTVEEVQIRHPMPMSTLVDTLSDLIELELRKQEYNTNRFVLLVTDVEKLLVKETVGAVHKLDISMETVGRRVSRLLVNKATMYAAVLTSGDEYLHLEPGKADAKQSKAIDSTSHSNSLAITN
jgi:hypothetical protein